MSGHTFYTEVYKQANSHHVETDKKRDQLLAFYAIVTGAFLGSYETLETHTQDLITIALVVFSIILVFIFISYRKWHIVYVNTAMVVQSLAISDKSFTKANISNTWNQLVGAGNYRKANTSLPRSFVSSTILSVEFMIFNAFLVISSPAIYLLFENVLNMQTWPFLGGLNLMGKYFISLAIYLVIANSLSSFIISRELARKHDASWLLRV
jgi:hypothetical protein